MGPLRERPRVRAGFVLALLLCLGLFLPLQAPAQTSSGPVFNPATGHWYESVGVVGGITWADAKAAAESRSYQGRQGYLATLTTAEENQWLGANLPLAKQGKYLLGGFQPAGSPEPAGGWRWVTDEPMNYIHWDQGEPNNVLTAEEVLALATTGRWNDARGSDLHPGYVVEYGLTPPTAQLITFAPPVDIPIFFPADLSAIDLDQDGHLDICAASNNDIAILYGRGDGTFQNPLYLGLNAYIAQTIAADVDGDGDLDIIAAGATTVHVVRRNLPRTYALPERYVVVPSRVYGVHARDFNGDGRPEIAVSNHDGHRLVILPNQGNGTYGTPTSYNAGSFPGRITSADWNGDGRVDLAMTNIVSGTVSLYYGNAQGGFSSQVTVSTNGQYPTQLVTTDMNGDGILDLVTGNTFGHTVAILRGNGNGTFQAGVTYPGNTYPHILAAVDLDNDGDPDIATPNNGTNYFTVLRNTAGVLGAPLGFTSTGNNTRTLAAGDFNEDGRIDIVVGNESSSSLSLFLNTTAFPAPVAPVGLVSWWRGEGNAQDATGRNPGQLANGTNFAPGVVGQAFSFDGINDGINLGDPDSLKLTQSFTFAAWIYVQSLPPAGFGRFILFRGDNRGGLDPYQFVVQSNGNLAVGINSLSASHGLATPIQTGRWVHVAATLDHASNALRLYLDGQQVAQSTTPTRPFRNLDPTQSPGVGIGNVQSVPNPFHNHPFHGRIDELQVYDRALTAPEIAELVGPVPSAPPAPVNLQATPVSESEIELLWQDNSSNETSFEVERRTEATPYAPIASLGANTNFYSSGGLSAETRYYFRVRARNAFGESAYSNEADAITLAPPPPPPLPAAPSGLVATPVSSAEIDLTWQDNSTTETAFLIERKTGSDPFAQIASVGANLRSYRSSGLNASTGYVYRVRARNATGDSAYSNEATGLTFPLPPPAFAAAAASASQINLTLTDGNSTPVGHRIERSANGGATYVEVAALPAGTTSHADTGLDADRTYHYRARAVNASGFSVYSPVSSARTLPTPPGRPENLAAAYLAGLGVRLTWTPGAGSTPAGIKVERSENAGGTFTQIGVTAGTGVLFDDTTAQLDRVYLYRVRAYNDGGHSLFTLPVTLTTPPAAPTQLALTEVTATRITLTWHDNSGTESGYRIERRVNNNPFGFLVQVGANAQTYADNSVSGNATYTYRVRALGPGGESPWSNEAGALAAPAPPVAVSATALSSHTVKIEWTDSNPSFVQHKLERSTDGGVTFSQVTVLNPGVAEYQDTGRGANTPYHYRLRASNASGDSQYSPTVSALTYPVAAANLVVMPVSASRLDLQWTDGNPRSCAHRIQRSTDGGNTFTTLATRPAGTTTYADESCQPNSTYRYRVAAENASAVSAYTATVQGLTRPAAPADFTAAGISQTRIRLQWSDTNPTPVAHQVEQSLDGGGAFSLLATVPAGTTTYEVEVANPAITYVYQVRAINASGPSPFAGPVSAAVLPAPPAAPTGLIARAITPDQIEVLWGDQSANETGFELERRTPTGAFTLLASLAANTTRYLDTDLGVETTYIYRLRAVNAGGASAYTSEVLVERPQGGKLVVAPAKVNFGTHRIRRGGPRPVRRIVTLRNTGRGSLGVSIGSLGAPFQITAGSGSYTLGPRKSLKVRVEFTPTTSGTYSAVLSVTSTDPAKSSVQVPVSARVR